MQWQYQLKDRQLTKKKFTLNLFAQIEKDPVPAITLNSDDIIMFHSVNRISNNKHALHTQGLAAGVKSGGEFPGGNFPQREMSNVGNYFLIPNFSPFQ